MCIDKKENVGLVILEEGVGYCVQTIAKGTTFFTTVLNPGNVTGNGHHRFTCLVISFSFIFQFEIE